MEGDVHNALIELLPVGRHLLDTGSTLQVPNPEHTSFHLQDTGSNLQVPSIEHTSFHLFDTDSTLKVPRNLNKQTIVLGQVRFSKFQPRHTSFHLFDTGGTLKALIRIPERIRILLCKLVMTELMTAV
jgi:hypothetical protein